MPAKFSRTGFTLIELLIAIAIISLLFGVVLVNSQALRSSSNDAKKKADLAQIQSALQNYFADQNYYPKSANGLVLGTTTALTSSVGSGPTVPSPVKTYLKLIPSDSSDAYCYFSARSGTTPAVACDNDVAVGGICNYYYLSAHLDSPPTGAAAPPAGVTCPVNLSTKNYTVTPN